MQDDPPGPKHTWSVRDCLGAIPDVVEEIVRGRFTCVSAHAVPVAVVNTDDGLALLFEQNESLVLPTDWRDLIRKRRHLFLYPMPVWGGDSYVMRPKLGAPPDIETVLLHASNGMTYASLEFRKQKAQLYLSPLVAYYIGLYALGMLSRYEPVKWGRFVDGDDRGTVELVASFVESAVRQVPNLVLDRMDGRIRVFAAGGVRRNLRGEPREHQPGTRPNADQTQDWDTL
jgi:hypothetical protein